MFESEVARFRELAPAVDYCSLRLVDETVDTLTVRKNILQPVQAWSSRGGMITVHHRGGTGYAATPDLSSAGIERAISRAKDWAAQTSGVALFDFSAVEMPHPQGGYRTPVQEGWESNSLEDKISRLQAISETMPVDPRIVDWHVSLMNTRFESCTVTSGGGEVRQRGRALRALVERFDIEPFPDFSAK